MSKFVAVNNLSSFEEYYKLLKIPLPKEREKIDEVLWQKLV